MRRPRRSRAGQRHEVDDEPVFSPNDPTGRALRETSSSPYADWQPGTLVSHDMFGVGTLEWIRPGGGQTQASIRFARHGRKTFILEHAEPFDIQQVVQAVFLEGAAGGRSRYSMTSTPTASHRSFWRN